MGAPLSAFETLCIVVVSTVLALILYKTVEQPLRKPWAKSGRQEKSIVPVRLVFGATIIALFSGYIFTKQGLPSRTYEDARIMTAQLSKARIAKCHKHEKSGRHCTIDAKDTPPQYILIGDSHAAALTLGIDKLSKDKGISGERALMRLAKTGPNCSIHLRIVS